MKFIKASFKSSTFNYKFKEKEYIEMLDLRMKMYSGLISRDNMMVFLKELSSCKPCEIKPEVITSEGVDDPEKDKNNFQSNQTNNQASEIDLLKANESVNVAAKTKTFKSSRDLVIGEVDMGNGLEVMPIT